MILKLIDWRMSVAIAMSLDWIAAATHSAFEALQPIIHETLVLFECGLEIAGGSVHFLRCGAYRIRR